MLPDESQPENSPLRELPFEDFTPLRNHPQWKVPPPPSIGGELPEFPPEDLPSWIRVDLRGEFFVGGRNFRGIISYKNRESSLGRTCANRNCLYTDGDDGHYLNDDEKLQKRLFRAALNSLADESYFP